MAIHIMFASLLLLTAPPPPRPPLAPAALPPVEVTLIPPRRPPAPIVEPGSGPGSEPGSPAPVASAAVRSETPSTPPAPVAAAVTTRARPIPQPVQPELSAIATVPTGMATVSEADLLGATRAGSAGGPGSGSGTGGGSGAGSAGGGGSCDMAARLQARLREDDDIRRTVAEAQRSVEGRALLVWDGDWRQNPGQAGKGLAGVRQAIALEIAFAPTACRTQAMRGLVLVTLSDGPGGARVALGTGRWRWSDLLS